MLAGLGQLESGQFGCGCCVVCFLCVISLCSFCALFHGVCVCVVPRCVSAHFTVCGSYFHDVCVGAGFMVCVWVPSGTALWQTTPPKPLLRRTALPGTVPPRTNQNFALVSLFRRKFCFISSLSLGVLSWNCGPESKPWITSSARETPPLKDPREPQTRTLDGPRP